LLRSISSLRSELELNRRIKSDIHNLYRQYSNQQQVKYLKEEKKLPTSVPPIPYAVGYIKVAGVNDNDGKDYPLRVVSASSNTTALYGTSIVGSLNLDGTATLSGPGNPQNPLYTANNIYDVTTQAFLPNIGIQAATSGTRANFGVASCLGAYVDETVNTIYNDGNLNAIHPTRGYVRDSVTNTNLQIIGHRAATSGTVSTFASPVCLTSYLDQANLVNVDDNLLTIHPSRNFVLDTNTSTYKVQGGHQFNNSGSDANHAAPYCVGAAATSDFTGVVPDQLGNHPHQNTLLLPQLAASGSMLPVTGVPNVADSSSVSVSALVNGYNAGNAIPIVEFAGVLGVQPYAENYTNSSSLISIVANTTGSQRVYSSLTDNSGFSSPIIRTKEESSKKDDFVIVSGPTKRDK